MITNIKNVVEKYLEFYPQEEEKLNELKMFINETHEIDNLYNRKNFVGHITASGFIYSKNEGKILLLEHKVLNKFIQPGGHVELSDNEIIDTAKREILEETGLKNLKSVNISLDKNVPLDINSHVIPKNENKNEEEHYHHDFRFLFITESVKDIIIDKSESNQYEWIDISKLKNDKAFNDISIKILSLLNNNYKI